MAKRVNYGYQKRQKKKEEKAARRRMRKEARSENEQPETTSGTHEAPQAVDEQPPASHKSELENA